MRTCDKCKETKFWFQFYSKNDGFVTWTYDVCRKCANIMKDDAVEDYQMKPNKK